MTTALTCPRRLAALAAALLAPLPASAATGMPWETPIQRIVDSIQGPVVQGAVILAIIFTGVALAFGGLSGVARRLVGVVFGLSIALAASSFFLTFFGNAGTGSLLP